MFELVIITCAFIGFIVVLQLVGRVFRWIFYPKPYKRYYKNFYQPQIQESQKLSFADKLNLVENANLKAKNPLNYQEVQIFKALIFEKSLKDNFSILPQVAMRAFIHDIQNDNEVWKTYSNSYVDFLLAKRDFKYNKDILTPFAVIEFHGSGHYGVDNSSDEHMQSVKNNDEIKAQILNKIGIKLFIIKGEQIYDESNRIDIHKLKAEIAKIVQNIYQC
ncbi:hypothetical protein CQA49_09440 [Helicobacter sp. MIT 00-7814]|uniref:DUF2726 domain-containing protein n=1 Tax=unclassified Helicobacter TaxID=2593540 RepID=UPI000E1E402B|nr:MULTISPECIES: DUF2726 domain-containing protein [unclassified Helicobacter]RDU51547.1 hypothetical protein CQA49_09440 [Helicobacter sp. MIT 00-7814]RDU51633.1 hypothetical protein CQA37_09485 [Helicobacter sp. MIT 99-10781]